MAPAVENKQPKPKGGKRPGSGRKLGSATRKTREIADAAAEQGITPLEFMLQVLRDQDRPFDARYAAAKDAAPYIHPRLAAVDANLTGKLDLVGRIVWQPPR